MGSLTLTESEAGLRLEFAGGDTETILDAIEEDD